METIYLIVEPCNHHPPTIGHFITSVILGYIFVLHVTFPKAKCIKYVFSECFLCGNFAKQIFILTSDKMRVVLLGLLY